MKITVNEAVWMLAGALSIFSLGLSAQTPAPTVPQSPITTIELEEEYYDFGTVEEGDLVTKVFTFTNTGEEPLTISKARGNCGCTVPRWPKDPISPGETASVTVEFNTKGKIGKLVKRISLATNTDPSLTFVYLKGEVLPRSDAASSNDRP